MMHTTVAWNFGNFKSMWLSEFHGDVLYFIVWACGSHFALYPSIRLICIDKNTLQKHKILTRKRNTKYTSFLNVTRCLSLSDFWYFTRFWDRTLHCTSHLHTLEERDLSSPVVVSSDITNWISGPQHDCVTDKSNPSHFRCNNLGHSLLTI